MSNMGYTYMVLILGSDSPDSLSLYWECDSLSLNCVQEESNVTFGWTVPLKGFILSCNYFYNISTCQSVFPALNILSIQVMHPLDRTATDWYGLNGKLQRHFCHKTIHSMSAVLKTRGLLEVCRLLMKCFDVFAMNVSSTVVSLKRKRITIKIS